MFRSIAVAAGAIATLACVAGRSAAQNESALAGYIALNLTPTAGLTPVVRPWMAGIPQSGVGIDARWGNIGEAGVHTNTFAAGVSIPVASGQGDVTLSAGYQTTNCDGCDGQFMAGVAVERGLVRQELSGNGAQFGLGINTSFGFGKPQGGSVLSAAVGAPIYLAAGKPGKLQVVPFLTPSLGWGIVMPDEIDSQSGFRFMMGGGIGLVNAAPGVNVQLGVQKTFIAGGNTVFGAGLSYMIPR